MILAALAAAFALAIYLQLRGVGAARAIALSAALVPAGVLFQAFIYPGDPELAEHWLIAASISFFFGALAASFGYFVVPLLSKRNF